MAARGTETDDYLADIATNFLQASESFKFAERKVGEPDNPEPTPQDAAISEIARGLGHLTLAVSLRLHEIRKSLSQSSQ